MESTRRGRTASAGAALTYALLFVLGALEGLLGCFQYSHSVGMVPVAALVSTLVVFITCLLAGIGMGTPLGGLMAALGWFLASLVLTLPTAGGSVVVTNTAAGKWFLYGGALAAVAGVALTVRRRRHR